MKKDNSFKLISNINNNMDKLLLEELNKLGLTDISVSHGQILISLYLQDGLSMSTLSSKINKKAQTTTTLVKKLVDKTYLETKVSSEDKRITYVYLTSKANEIKTQVLEISNKLYNVQYQNFTEEEITAFRTLLTKMNNNF